MTEPWTWRKSSFSAGENVNCVEVAWSDDHVMVRDSYLPFSTVLRFPLSNWQAFVDHTVRDALSGADELQPLAWPKRASQRLR
ncbi:DUF397 domain-containing protein [Streptomyces sp. NPDC005407]|uniref:DUF397 domain-containing protein n=1 Tax=Streptomyces sp. NPDC005407 TaxID=3155340 RepID=UPI0033A08512